MSSLQNSQVTYTKIGISNEDKCQHCKRVIRITDKDYCETCEKLYCKQCGPIWMKRPLGCNNIICKDCRKCPLHNKEECESCELLRIKLSGMDDSKILRPSDINPNYKILLLYKYSETVDGVVTNYEEESETGFPSFFSDMDFDNNGKFNEPENVWYYHIESRRLIKYMITKL